VASDPNHTADATQDVGDLTCRKVEDRDVKG
jgi:hypothetical protein